MLALALCCMAALSWVYIMRTSRASMPLEKQFSERQATIRGVAVWSITILTLFVIVIEAFAP